MFLAGGGRDTTGFTQSDDDIPDYVAHMRENAPMLEDAPHQIPEDDEFPRQW